MVTLPTSIHPLIVIRHATPADLAQVKRLADANKDTLGFVLRPALEAGINRRWLLVAEHVPSSTVIGFAHYWHRKDTQTTLHELCVHTSSRCQGIGHALLDMLVQETAARGQTALRLKVVQGITANTFYEHYGFTCVGSETGKRRALFIWHLSVQEVHA
jgi:ribosomal protein S18 acetylase RimI-like enzyme